MKKEQLEKFNNLSRDLLEWIKYFLQDKLVHQKIEEDYCDDKEAAQEQNLKYFDRKLWQLKIMETSTHKELETIARQVKNNGVKAHGTFSVPLLKFYEYVLINKRLKLIRDINTDLINTYIETNLSDKKEWTQRNYYNQIKSLFKFIDKYSISDDNFIFDVGITSTGKRVKTPIKSIPEKSVKYLEPDEFVDFIASIKTYKNNHPNNVQPTLLMKVISLTGLRAFEARSIKLKDVSTRAVDGEKYLRIGIKGKSNIDDFVFISYKLIQKEYEQELKFRKENKLETDYLFYTRDFQQYAEKSVYDLIKRYLKHAGIIKPIDSKGLAFSYAIYLLANGVSREKISHLLSYTDRGSWDMYAFTREKFLKSSKDIIGVI